MREALEFILERGQARGSFHLAGRPRALRTFAAILLAAMMLLWPMIVNHGPFLLSDTSTYIRGADAAIYKLSGKPSDWSDRYVELYRGLSAKRQAPDESRAQESERPVTLAGRSIYYGLFVYLSDIASGLWLAAALQALLTAACIYVTLQRFRSGDFTVEFLLIAGALSTASSLSYFVSYLMPDIFTGLGLLAAAHLFAKTPSLTQIAKAFWFILLCLSGLFHTANMLILLVVFAVLCAIPATRKPASGIGIWLVLASLLFAFAGEAVFYTAVVRSTGDPPIRPPFLAARLIADGPGRAFLQDACPRSGFALCQHRDSLSGSSDDFLWSEHSYNGVFSTVSNAERRRIAAEENRFVIEVIIDRPLEVLRTSLLAIKSQFLMWRLPEFNLSPEQRDELAAKLPARVQRKQSQTRAFSGTMPVGLANVLTLPVALCSLCFILWAFVRRKMAKGSDIFAAVLLVGVAADGAICGAISTPHDRYVMRVVWLVPLAALVVQTVIRDRLARRLESAPAIA